LQQNLAADLLATLPIKLGARHKADMLFFIQLVVACAVAITLGLATARHAITQGIGFESVTRGSWTSWPQAGGKDIDPYTRAVFASNRELPTAGENVVVFSASTDDEGQALRANCTYRVRGKAPPAQYWTLNLYLDSKKAPIQNKAKRSGFSSSEVLYRADSSFEISIARAASPENWIPIPADIGNDEALRLFMRFYDTPVSFGRDASTADMPLIVRGSCS
jgi:hypothetical protein